ncbi:unnamed protein product [Protopolystoma xenopodis]|uniref:Protein kinase domain-containing protein n=1 Tax=Protopolystoma xenopodis TaxID=117903 RepID=A0A448XPS1_9PLAT|nr:unnamed protein product [Protopolystoma xenopodis]
MSNLLLITESELVRGPLIGSGAFGTVYQGFWYPQCAAGVRIKSQLIQPPVAKPFNPEAFDSACCIPQHYIDLATDATSQTDVANSVSLCDFMSKPSSSDQNFSLQANSTDPENNKLFKVTSTTSDKPACTSSSKEMDLLQANKCPLSWSDRAPNSCDSSQFQWPNETPQDGYLVPVGQGASKTTNSSLQYGSMSVSMATGQSETSLSLSASPRHNSPSAEGWSTLEKDAKKGFKVSWPREALQTVSCIPVAIKVLNDTQSARNSKELLEEARVSPLNTSEA